MLLAGGCATPSASAASDHIEVEARVASVTGPTHSPYCADSADQDSCGEWELSLSELKVVAGRLTEGRRFFALYLVDDNGHVLSRIPPPPLLVSERSRHRLTFERQPETGAYALSRASRIR